LKIVGWFADRSQEAKWTKLFFGILKNFGENYSIQLLQRCGVTPFPKPFTSLPVFNPP
jgi:hypothetical protein